MNESSCHNPLSTGSNYYKFPRCVLHILLNENRALLVLVIAGGWIQNSKLQRQPIWLRKNEVAERKAVVLSLRIFYLSQDWVPGSRVDKTWPWLIVVLLITLTRQLIRDVRKKRKNLLTTDMKLEVTHVLNIGLYNEIGMLFNIILHNEIRSHIKLKSVKKVKINYYFSLFEVIILGLYISWRN